jgi:hypothetical protein
MTQMLTFILGVATGIYLAAKQRRYTSPKSLFQANCILTQSQWF